MEYHHPFFCHVFTRDYTSCSPHNLCMDLTYSLCLYFVSTNYVVLSLWILWFCVYQLCGFASTNYVVLSLWIMWFCVHFLWVFEIWYFSVFHCFLFFNVSMSYVVLCLPIMWFCVYQLCGFVSIVYEFLKSDTFLYFIVSSFSMCPWVMSVSYTHLTLPTICSV